MKWMQALVTKAVYSVLVAHVVLTAFENLPDAKLGISSRIPWIGRLPQWRFFAPNPGVENTHVFFRISSAGAWGLWKEIPCRNQLRWYSLFWNPASRAPKAVFDLAQQLRVLSGFGASYEWARSSHAYQLLQSIARDESLREGGRETFQFMIVTAQPGGEVAGMQRILTSTPESTNNGSSYRG